MFAFTESESSMLTLETAVEVKKIPLVGPYSQEELLNVLCLFWERKCKVRAVRVKPASGAVIIQEKKKAEKQHYSGISLLVKENLQVPVTAHRPSRYRSAYFRTIAPRLPRKSERFLLQYTTSEGLNAHSSENWSQRSLKSRLWGLNTNVREVKWGHTNCMCTLGCQLIYLRFWFSFQTLWPLWGLRVHPPGRLVSSSMHQHCIACLDFTIVEDVSPKMCYHIRRLASQSVCGQHMRRAAVALRMSPQSFSYFLLFSV